MHAHFTLSGPQAGAIAQRARYLLRKRQITPYHHALIDVMLWACRKPGSATLVASLNVLARLAGQSRGKVAEGIKRLEELGVIQRTRRRVRVAWVAGATASRQVANLYTLKVPDTESTGRTAREQSSIIYSIAEVSMSRVKAAQEFLEEIAKRQDAQFLREWAARRAGAKRLESVAETH